ncbi:MAG TPA: NAD+ synthase [Gammaproteobacteria bacterium]|nr:NAD+ synthase [Gammaproteobacteria bacterium]OUX34595.1 MAG: NAD+ synthase [Gammaproteobacteria bacterium TMED260]HBP99545.1 NAD+ synthase [Gammaproteobacteria bacterium]
MTTRFKIIMAQLDFLVGDIDGNTDKIIRVARRASEELGADMVVFPELAITGYPPEDLLLRPSLKPRITKALDRICVADIDAYLVVGYPETTAEGVYNALAVLRGSKVIAGYRKQCLPNYQVFDERRYFRAGSQPCVIDIAGARMAFTVCEDLWEPEPARQAKEAGAHLLVNINASPFHMRKLQERQELLQQRSREGGFPVVYVNLVGGQDELVFDGGSMAASQGELNCLIPQFQEGLFPLDIEIAEHGSCEIPRQAMAETLDLEAQVYEALVMGVRDYVEKNRFKGVVLGLSGGIDSALSLAIAADALGSAKVQAVMMPFAYTSQLSLDCAQQQAQSLGVNYQVIAINEIYDSFTAALKDEFAGLESDVTEQNIQARARGVLLMAISNKKGLLVLTTGNKSEIAVGYSTLYGDMAGGFDVLKDVSKTLVYRLARFRNSIGAGKTVIPAEVIDRAPSAELAPGQVDQDSLPDYDTLDEILELYVEQDQSAKAIMDKGYTEADVKRVLRLVDLNEYKRRQSPVGVRLTQRGFGRDRRYPITNGWPLGE